MKTIKIIFLYLFFGLSCFHSRGQQIANYINNGGFEEVVTNTMTPAFPSPKYWGSTDSMKFSCEVLSKVLIPIKVPLCGYTYQWPRHGNNDIITKQFCPTCSNNIRTYPRNRLKQTLKPNTTYCFSMYINLSNQSTHAIDAIGAYFADNSIDTITQCNKPITYLTPQVQNAANNILTDTLKWVLIQGQYTSTGTEKYVMIGNFKSDLITNTVLVNPAHSPLVWADYLIDDVSLIESNLPAYAGQDTIIFPSDSVFLGRQSDVGIDEACFWYLSPNMTIPFDTIAGFWVKPTSTTTYVVRQDICGNVKWDTVVVTISTNYVGLDKLKNLSDNINLFPNPTSGNLSISGFSGADISTFSISNCLGQIIQIGNIIPKNNLIDVETSELKSGLYQIHLKTQYGIVTKKFVKTN